MKYKKVVVLPIWILKSNVSRVGPSSLVREKDFTIWSKSAVHLPPFYISICIWTLPTQQITFTYIELYYEQVFHLHANKLLHAYIVRILQWALNNYDNYETLGKNQKETFDNPCMYRKPACKPACRPNVHRGLTSDKQSDCSRISNGKIIW